jgi:hypothetical protein
MIKHKIFTKGDKIHALLSNKRFPNILFPVRAIIYDVKFDENMPRYMLKIDKMYDDIDFLKRYFFGLTFDGSFEGKQTKINLSRREYSKVEDLERLFSEKWESYMFAVDSIFCVKTRIEQLELFNNLHDFFIEKHLKELYELSNRSAYSKGKYYYHVKDEFVIALKKFLGERAPDQKDYFDKLLYRSDSAELDKIDKG